MSGQIRVALTRGRSPPSRVLSPACSTTSSFGWSRFRRSGRRSPRALSTQRWRRLRQPSKHLLVPTFARVSRNVLSNDVLRRTKRTKLWFVTAELHSALDDRALQIPRLLEVASNPNTHWRYSLNATRLLRQLIRRDQPLDPALATFFAKQMIAELPNKRVRSISSLPCRLADLATGALDGGDDQDLALCQAPHARAQRRRAAPAAVSQPAQGPQTITGSPAERLHEGVSPAPHGGPSDPLMCTAQVHRIFRRAVAQRFKGDVRAASYSEGFADGDRRLLMDKLSTGWLVWGHDVDFYRVPPATGPSIVWDPASHDALDQLEALFTSESFWRSVGSHFSQEHTRNYLACVLRCILGFARSLTRWAPAARKTLSSSVGHAVLEGDRADRPVQSRSSRSSTSSRGTLCALSSRSI